MSGNPTNYRYHSLSLIATIFGVFSGIGGFTHAVGEMLQGSVPPSGIYFNSWAQGPIAAYMGGEPAMTLIPNLLFTGILNAVISIAIIIWSAAYIQKKNGGRLLVILSVLMLLVGGGFGPPVIGMLAGVAGTGISSPLEKWRKRVSGNLQSALAKLWPWVFGVCLANGLLLFIGSLVAVYILDINNPDLFTNSFFFAVLSFPLMILTGIARDISK